AVEIDLALVIGADLEPEAVARPVALDLADGVDDAPLRAPPRHRIEIRRLLADLHQKIGPRQTFLGLKDRACALVNEVAYKASPPGTQAWARMHPRPSLYRFTARPRKPPARSAASGAQGNGPGPG